MRRNEDAAPSEQLRMEKVTESTAAAIADAGQNSGSSLQPRTFVLKARRGKHRGKTTRVSEARWRELLRDKVRALGTWARVMRVRERKRALARWKKACTHVKAEIKKTNEDEIKRREEQERRARREREEGNGVRHSRRLGALPEKSYSRK